MLRVCSGIGVSLRVDTTAYFSSYINKIITVAAPVRPICLIFRGRLQCLKMNAEVFEDMLNRTSEVLSPNSLYDW